MSFLKNIFHHNANYEQTPPVHMIYPAREAYQMPIDYNGTNQWQQPQYQYGGFQGNQQFQQQQFQGGFPSGLQQGMGGVPQMQQMGMTPPMPMDVQGGVMMQPHGFNGMPIGFGGPMGGQLNYHQQHQGGQHMMGGGQCPGGHQHGGMEQQRVIIPGQHGVLVIEGPGTMQGIEQGGPNPTILGRHHGAFQ